MTAQAVILFIHKGLAARYRSDCMCAVTLSADIWQAFFLAANQACMNRLLPDLIIRVAIPAYAGGHDLVLFKRPEPS